MSGPTRITRERSKDFENVKLLWIDKKLNIIH